MSRNDEISKERLLLNMREGWEQLTRYLFTLTPDQVCEPKDAAGWTPKDHLAHLAVWEDGINALLEKRSRYAAMGLDFAAWESGDFDRMNAIIQQRTRDLPLSEVHVMLEGAHRRLTSKVEAMTQEDLYLPYSHFQEDSARGTRPVVRSIIADSYAHFEQHLEWIKAIIDANPHVMSKERLLEKMGTAWDELTTFLDSIPAERMTGRHDGGGWTAKDHVIHLAVWADGINALLQQRSRCEAMGVDRATWEAHDVDATNDVIYRRHKDMPLDEARAALKRAHEGLVATINGLTTDDLYRSYGFYAGTPDGGKQRPVIDWIAGNTYDHYEEHLPWIKAIVK